MINQQLHNYKIISLLGEGGMAFVYLAHDNKFDTEVAIKILKKEFVQHSNIRKRFLAEARSLAKMNHPNVIKVTDLIDAGDIVAFVMEYIEGQTLEAFLSNSGKLPNSEIENMFSQMILAVEYVHSQGLIHRDIKPSNFMVTKGGQIKLLDFGIAKNINESAVDYTKTGLMQQMGTPLYMSPEQVKNTAEVTKQTDVYSLGVVLWQLVMNKKPYDSGEFSLPEIQVSILKESLPLTYTIWDSTIQEASAKDPTKRSLKINSKETVESKSNSDTIIDKANPISILKESLPLTHTIWYSTIQDATTKDPTKRSLKINSKKAVESKFNSDTIIDKANPIRAIQQQIFEHYTFLNQPGNFKLKTASIWLGILFLIYVLVYFFIYGEKSENKVSSFLDDANSEIVVPSKQMEDPILQKENPKEDPYNKSKNQNTPEILKEETKQVPLKKEKPKEIIKDAPIISQTILKIGQKHQGGIIFYLDDSGKHGKICAENDMGQYEWQDAINICRNLTLNGYSDWYLPSKIELNLVFMGLSWKGGFSNAFYWSSTQCEGGLAWMHIFISGGNQVCENMTTNISVRAIRTF